MSKSKRTPEQEPETADREQSETPGTAEDVSAENPLRDDSASHKPEKDNGEESSVPAENQPGKDTGAAEQSEAEEEVSKQEKPAAATVPQDSQLEQQLLEARGQLAAYAAGVDPAKIGDAVILASAEAQNAGDLTETGIAKAMSNVLLRHPEWKLGSGTKAAGAGGFRLGADPDKAGSRKTTANSGNTKRWNRYK